MTDEEESESSVLLEELQRQSRERQEQHQENIQILVALSIFAGYITAFFNNMFNNFFLNIATSLLASIVFVFLFYKLILNSRVANGDLITSEKVDRIFSGLFTFSVFGFGVVAVFIVAVEQLRISVESVPQLVMGLLMGSMLPIFLALSTLLGKKRKQTLHQQEEKLREELPKALEAFVNGDVLSQRKAQILDERLEALLERDRQGEPHWFLGGNLMMLGETDFASLTMADRKLLLNIIDRVKRRHKYEEYDEDDLAKIEAILERAEES